MDWQAIETAPVDGSPILLFGPLLGGIVIGHYRVNTLYGPTWSYEDGHSCALDVPSHWMPLPAQPKE